MSWQIVRALRDTPLFRPALLLHRARTRFRLWRVRRQLAGERV